MRYEFLLSGWFGLLTGAGSAQAFEPTNVQTLWALPAPTPKKDAEGRDLIRVRIYPHDQKAADKRAAEPLDKVTLEGACQAFLGKNGEAASSGKKIGKAKPGTMQRFNVAVAKLKAPLWLECSGPLLVQRSAPLTSHKYEGSFYIYRAPADGISPNPHVEIIAVMPLESYLRGVVPTEVIPSWPVETLKAQAIAARTYAYFNMAHNQYMPGPKIYDVDDTNHYQAFSGLTNINNNTDGAIAATKGQILNYKGMLFPTFFDTDHGGQLESAEEVFGVKAPYCNAKPDHPEVAKAAKPWTVTLKFADIEKAAAGVLNGKKIKALTVQSGDLTPGKRVRALQAELVGGGTATLPIAEFKKASPGIKSSLFTLSPVGTDQVKLDGKGSGHGVGLNQQGAKVLAATQGWTYQKIMEFYFQDVTLCGLAGGTGVPACQGTLAH